ncbi:lamin tail domain-containing protein, partial [bacterium]|nr:lamin tail domain-containing protein [bacterium]
MNRIFRPVRAFPGLLAAAALVVLAAGTAPAQVLINEFEHTGTGTDRIELVNTRPDTTYDLSAWYLENQVGSTFGLSGMLGPSDRKTFVTSGHIVTDGGLIELYDGALLIPHDSVPYG